MRIATKLSLMSVGTVCIILIIGITSYISVSNLITANQLFSHSREVLQELNMLLYNLSDTVGTQRAYMITAQEIYCDAYHALVSSTNESLQKIRQLISDNPTQVLRVDKLSILIKERLASLEVTNELYQQKGFEAASYRVRTGNSIKFRINLHRSIDEIKASEVDLLQKRDRELKRSASSTQLTIIAGTCLGLTLIILFSYLFARYTLNCLGQLIRAVDNIRYNRFDLAVSINSNDEFGVLASAFNNVSHQLLTMSNQLNKREQEMAVMVAEMQANEKNWSQSVVSTLLQRFNQIIYGDNKYPIDNEKSEALPSSSTKIVSKSSEK
jgi:CHASE3 domain sensor protein